MSIAVSKASSDQPSLQFNIGSVCRYHFLYGNLVSIPETKRLMSFSFCFAAVDDNLFYRSAQTTAHQNHARNLVVRAFPFTLIVEKGSRMSDAPFVNGMPFPAFQSPCTGNRTDKNTNGLIRE